MFGFWCATRDSGVFRALNKFGQHWYKLSIHPSPPMLPTKMVMLMHYVISERPQSFSAFSARMGHHGNDNHSLWLGYIDSEKLVIMGTFQIGLFISELVHSSPETIKLSLPSCTIRDICVSLKLNLCTHLWLEKNYRNRNARIVATWWKFTFICTFKKLMFLKFMNQNK